jgi:hypothetical protein
VPRFVSLVGVFGVSDGAGAVGAVAAGNGSPLIHHFFTPLIMVQTKVFPLISLTAENPSSEFGQVRPGAATPSGYPSSGLAALAGARMKSASEEIKVKERKE